jgi:hypothetical protein
VGVFGHKSLIPDCVDGCLLQGNVRMKSQSVHPIRMQDKSLILGTNFLKLILKRQFTKFFTDTISKHLHD